MKNIFRLRKRPFTYEKRLILQDCWEFRHMELPVIARYLQCSVTFLELELQRGDNVYEPDINEKERLQLLNFRTRVRYNATLAQSFIDRYQLSNLEHNLFTPALKYFLEQRLRHGLSPEMIVQQYADHVPVTARSIRRY